MTPLTRLRHAWLVFRGRAIAIDADISAVSAEARDRIGHLVHACHLMELPMSLIDEINKIDAVFANALAAASAGATALAAANQANAELSNQLAAANATIADLQSQTDQATAALQALEAKYTPPA